MSLAIIDFSIDKLQLDHYNNTYVSIKLDVIIVFISKWIFVGTYYKCYMKLMLVVFLCLALRPSRLYLVRTFHHF